jgi:hypothetical protein
MSVKIIPITKEYRERHVKIKWDDKPKGAKPPKKGMPSNPKVEECVKIYPAVGWVIPHCNYQGC